MSLRKALAFVIVSLACSGQSLAGGAAHNTTILEIGIHKVHGNYVFIRLASTPSTPAVCSVNGHWHFTLSLTNAGDRELYAMLLAAHASGKTVSLTGLGVCNEFSAIESLNSINVL